MYKCKDDKQNCINFAAQLLADFDRGNKSNDPQLLKDIEARKFPVKYLQAVFYLEKRASP